MHNQSSKLSNISFLNFEELYLLMSSEQSKSAVAVAAYWKSKVRAVQEKLKGSVMKISLLNALGIVKIIPPQKSINY